MPTEIDWKPRASTSALHAACRLIEGKQLLDKELARALHDPAETLSDILTRCGAVREIFLFHLVGLSAEIGFNQELAKRALAKTVGHCDDQENTVSHLSAAISAIENQFQRRFPNCQQELHVRAEPIRLQWQARGPGLLRYVDQFSEPAFVVQRASIILVPPLLGGYGTAFLPYNSILLETLLANPHQQLPEVVRLGWLIAQLNLDLPRFSEPMARDHLRRFAAIATLPIVLRAAQEVELVPPDADLIRFALEAWDVQTADHHRPSQLDQLAELLAKWDRALEQQSPRLDVALGGLYELLVESELITRANN